MKHIRPNAVCNPSLYILDNKKDREPTFSSTNTTVIENLIDAKGIVNNIEWSTEINHHL